MKPSTALLCKLYRCAHTHTSQNPAQDFFLLEKSLWLHIISTLGKLRLGDCEFKASYSFEVQSQTHLKISKREGIGKTAQQLSHLQNTRVWFPAPTLGCTQSLGTAAPGALAPSSGLPRYCACACTDTNTLCWLG